jgi:hypothetical protein
MKVQQSQAKRARLAEQYAALGRVGTLKAADMKALTNLPGKPNPVRG